MIRLRLLPTTIARPYLGVLTSSYLLKGAPRTTLSPSSLVVPKAAASASSPIQAFHELGLSGELLQALEEKEITVPTEIQSFAIPKIINNVDSDFTVASHTGSGKTLAYLLPIVHILKEKESLKGVASRPKRPRALILGPTRELAEQVLMVAKSLSHAAKFRSAVITGVGGRGTQRDQLAKPLDILVGTPTRVVQHAKEGNLFYGDVEFLVLDEADTMFDRGFLPEVREIIKAVKTKPLPSRCILVSATMTKAVHKVLSEDLPGVQTIETKSLHKGVPGARHSFLPLPPQTDKLTLLSQLTEGELKRGKRVMVFCNTVKSCRAAEHALREAGLSTVCYHGDVPLVERQEAIKKFSLRLGTGGAGTRVDRTAEEINPPLLVCTDLAARGLDIPGKVDHIINFEFPLSPIDYLHRSGRTARAGAVGKVTSIVGKGDRILASRIEECLEKGLPLDALSADRKVLPLHMRPKAETLKRKALEKKAEKHSRKGLRGAARVNDSNLKAAKSKKGTSQKARFK